MAQISVRDCSKMQDASFQTQLGGLLFLQVLPSWSCCCHLVVIGARNSCHQYFWSSFGLFQDMAQISVRDCRKMEDASSQTQLCGLLFLQVSPRWSCCHLVGSAAPQLSCDGWFPCCHGGQMAKFDPFLSLDCARVEGVGAQSKERKGSNFVAQRR